MDHIFPHYQTSFSVEASEIALGTLFEQLQETFRRWVIKQENARARRFNNKAYGLLPDTHFPLTSECHSWRSECQTLAGTSEEGSVWALRYSWKDDETEGLSWLCEATLHAHPSTHRITLSLLLQRILSPDLFQKEDLHIPDPTPPACIRRILDSMEGLRFVSGTIDITPPQGRFLRIAETPEAVSLLVDDLRSPTRNLPFLLLLGAATDPSNFAESLAHDLAGKAVVCNVPNRAPLLAPLAPFKLSCGQCRILFPYNRFGPRLRAHPLGSFATTADAEALRAFARPLVLSQFTASEPGALSDFHASATLLERALLAQRRSALLRGPSSTDSWEALAKDLYSETVRLRKAYSDRTQELTSLRDRLFIAEKLAASTPSAHPHRNK